MLTAGVMGGPELRYVAGKLRKAAARDLTRELRTGQRNAVKPLQPAIKASALAMLPKRGGYAALMAKDIKVSIRAGVRRGTLTARVFARGKTELRDVVAVNNGILRHPTFRNRSKWHITRVARGFVDKPADELADRMLAEAADAVQRVVTEIARS